MSLSAPLLPLRRRAPALPWLVAATTMLLLIAAAAALGLRAAADTVERATTDRLLVQVVAPDRSERDRTATTALALLVRDPGVLSAERVPDREVQRLVAPYIAEVSSTLPLPALIEARLRPGSRTAALVHRLDALPGTLVASAEGEARPFADALAGLRLAAGAIILVSLGAGGLIAIVTARSAMAADRTTLATLHELGATDSQLARLVTSTIGYGAVLGAGVGVILAALVIAPVGQRLVSLGLPPFRAGAWLLLAGLPLGVIGLVLVAAYATLILGMRRQS